MDDIMHVVERSENKMDRRKGFTLIELLAVIVILAVIALIATPLVMNIIERAEKGAFRDGVYGIMEAAEFQVILDDSKYPIIFRYPEDSERIQFKGTKPTEGYIQIVSEGKIKLVLGNGRWCAVKDANESQISITNGHCEKINLNLPIINGYGDLNQKINLNETFVLPSVTAIDKEGNKLNVITTIKQGDNVVDKIDISKEASYTIIYTTEPDKDGNTNSVTVTIKVIKRETDTDKVIEAGLEKGGLQLVGDTYYYRGEDVKNWVQINDLSTDNTKWRIISIRNGMMKLIRQNNWLTNAWDQTGGRNGSHDWERPADINTALNTTYYETIKDIDSKIAITDFFIGKISWDGTSTVSAASVKSNEEQKKWTGRIGLINASDYAYASLSPSCEMSAIDNINCGQNNWLITIQFRRNGVWTMNASDRNDLYLLYVDDRNLYDNRYPNYAYQIYPVIYLKADVKIISGDGTEKSPFVIQ